MIIRSRSVLAYLIVVATTIVAMMAFSGLFLWHSYQVATQNAATTTQDVAQLLELHFSAIFRRSDAILADFGHEVIRLRDPGTIESRRSEIATHLGHLLYQFPDVTSINYFDAAGRLRYSSWPEAAVSNIQDRAHFKALRDNPAQQRVISNALKARTTGRWSVVVAHGVRAADGEFLGVVTALIDLERQQQFLQALNIGKHGSVVFRRLDNTAMLLRFPLDEQGMNKPLPKDNPVRQQIDSGHRSGTLAYRSVVDGLKRTVTYHALPEFPVYIQVGLAKADYLASWYSEIKLTIVLNLVFTLVLAIGVAKVIRSRRMEERFKGDLEERESRLHSIIQNEPECIKVLDAAGRLLEMNQAGLRMIEADSLEQVAGLPAYGMVAPQYRRDFAEMHRRVIAGETVLMEFEAIGLKGGRRWLESHAAPLQQANGEVFHLAVTRDITERKRAEAAIHAAAKYARSLIEASLDPLVTISPEGKVTDVNMATEAVTGVSREQLIGSNFSDYFTDPDKANAGYQQVLQQGKVTDYPLAIRHLSGKITDVLYNASVYRDDNGNVLGVFAAARDVTERKKIEDQVRQMAFQDRLTGLPNRRLLEDRLNQSIARAQRDKLKMSLMFIDLDKFKQINDTLGHETGDWLLQRVAERMLQSIRTSDTVSRVGGDEFVVLLPDAGSVAGAVSVAEKIRMALNEPFATEDGKILNISSSIGVVMFPDHADNARDLLRLGDEAMYRAKKGGRNAVNVFAPSHENFVQLNWKPEYECGEPSIDQEHKELFRLANKLLSVASGHATSPDALAQAFDNLVEHVTSHFAHEEQIQQAHGYADQDEHAEKHRMLLKRIAELRQQSTETKVPVGKLVEFLVSEVLAEVVDFPRVMQ